jgi:endo-alpha-1,4-polygalactosaminidase (GH114 family)
MENKRFIFLIREIKAIYRKSNNDTLVVMDKNGNFIIAFHCNSKFSKLISDEDDYCIDRLRIWIVKKESPVIKTFKLNDNVNYKLECEVI